MDTPVWCDVSVPEDACTDTCEVTSDEQFPILKSLNRTAVRWTFTVFAHFELVDLDAIRE